MSYISSLVDPFFEGEKPQHELVDMPSTITTVTTPQIFGPFYVMNAPFRAALAPIGAKGVPLVLSGHVFGLESRKSVPNVVIDMWQASGEAEDGITGSAYDYFEPTGESFPYSIAVDRQINTHGSSKEYRFRCRLTTDDRGEYQVQTVMPVAYYDPADGTWRCPHIHAYIHHPGYKPLVTQIYFEGQEKNDIDAHRRPELTIPTTSHSVNEQTFLSATFNFVLGSP